MELVVRCTSATCVCGGSESDVSLEFELVDGASELAIALACGWKGAACEGDKDDVEGDKGVVGRRRLDEALFLLLDDDGGGGSGGSDGSDGGGCGWECEPG